MARGDEVSDDQPAGTAVYAKCVSCHVEFATPDRAAAHRRETFEAARAETHMGGERRGHATRIVNATAEEAREWKIRRVVEDALEEAYLRLDDAIDRRGEVTFEEVYAELRWQDAGDGYLQWREDNELDTEDEPETVEVHPDQEKLL
jgi:hypothetical protein